MPLSDTVDHARRQRSDNENPKRMAKGESPTKRGRRGIPADLDDSPISILSPLLSHLPSLSGIPSLSLKGFLPTSPARQMNGHSALPEITKATWQDGDLGDGRGEIPLLLVTSQHHALQIFTIPPNTLPDNPHVQETFPPPEEVFSLPAIRYDGNTVRTAMSGETVSGTSAHGVEQVLDVQLLRRGRLWKERGPEVACVTLTPSSRKSSGYGALALVIVSLRTGVATRRVDLGLGNNASLASSTRAIAVSFSHPVATVHLLDPITLSPVCSPVTDLPCDSGTGLPIFALFGRLLAVATAEPPQQPGPNGLGSLVTAKSLSRPRNAKAGPSSIHAGADQARPVDIFPSGAVLSSAVEIGGGVARGVWAGLKMGARAAGKARNTRLARSAPSEASGSLVEEEDKDGIAESESRSLDDSSLLDEPVAFPSSSAGVQWIKVLDIAPTRLEKPPQTKTPSTALTAPFVEPKQSNSTGSVEAETVAHFRTPLTPYLIPSRPSTAPHLARRVSVTCPEPISFLSFSPTGTQLFIAPGDGRAFHIVDLHPAGAIAHGTQGECKGQAWHLYELRRGTTTARVCEITWDSAGRWVGVGTGHGTTHVFPISPSGGPPSRAIHAASRLGNPAQLSSLSTILRPITRLRPLPPNASAENIDQSASQKPGIFTFICYRKNPLEAGSFCQNIAVFRPSTAQLEVARLSVQAVAPGASDDTHGTIKQRRHSALTEMMISGAGLRDKSDLTVTHAVKARWLLPTGADPDQPILSVNCIKPERAQTIDPQRSRSLAHAEIQTHCINPHILPTSIYLSRQMDFFAAKPIDEYSPLSILDLDARTERLLFRHEVEAQPGSPEAKSFDEPLISALHSVIESPPASQIPGLPNGSPMRNKWRTSMPIRHVAAGLGEGVDRVRREYVRAQYSRSFRRESEAAANQLSFEEDAVFASGDEGSSPSSGVLPESSAADEDREEPDGWGEGWEEEYRRAVEDDGGPDDLVLGLLDEGEEERRKWELRQKAMARQYAK